MNYVNPLEEIFQKREFRNPMEEAFGKRANEFRNPLEDLFNKERIENSQMILSPSFLGLNFQFLVSSKGRHPGQGLRNSAVPVLEILNADRDWDS